MSDSDILTELRIAVARIEQRQIHILELFEDHKGKMKALEDEAGTIKGRVWLISTIVFGVLAAAWEIIKNRLLGHP
jgi:hypothetical protein